MRASGPVAEELKRCLRRALFGHLLNVGLRDRAGELAALGDCEELLKGAFEDKGLNSGLEAAASNGSYLLEESIVSMVDSVASAAECIKALAAAKGPVGLDTEWPPNETNVSIVQLATEDRVWIIDITWALAAQHLEVVEAFRQLLLDDQVIKLGFGFQMDLDRLHDTLRGCGGLAGGVRSLVDVQVDQRGLAALLKAVTGLVLDKAEWPRTTKTGGKVRN